MMDTTKSNALASEPARAGFDVRDLVARFDEARERTLALIEPLSDEDLYRQHNSLMSPIAWDLGHIGNFEELWGIRSLPDAREVHPELDDTYDATLHPRATRASLELPNREELREYLTSIRRVLKHGIEKYSDRTSESRLLDGGYVYEMLLQHEYQHNETILQTLQLKSGSPYSPTLESRPVPDVTAEPEMVSVNGATCTVGTDQFAGTYDNERPAIQVDVLPFRIGKYPVSNGEYLQFIEDGGYSDRSLWDDEAWQFLQAHNIAAPMFWRLDDNNGWTVRRMNREEKVDLREPVMHICWHEASAFARFAGMRLPTEFEWERAASWSDTEAEASKWPWGNSEWTIHRANLDVQSWQPTPIGAYPDGVSPAGCHQMIGDVWEWVESDFRPYPGYRSFPYREYSEIFFGDEYKVLRGGSWATRPGAVRTTFRNWDYPIRRQLFAGFRLAATVD